MNEPNPRDESALRFQQIWSEAISRLGKAKDQSREGLASGFQGMRHALTQAMAETWEEFSKSETFQKALRSAVEQAASLRSSARDAFKTARQETQGVTRDDFEQLRLTLKNAEQLLLTRIDLLEQRLLSPAQSKTPRPTRRAPSSRKARPHSRRKLHD